MVDACAQTLWISSWTTPTIAIILILGIIHYLQTNTRTARLARKIPGPPTWPFIGNAHMVFGLKNHHHLFKRAARLSKQYGSIVRGWIGRNLVVFLMHPSDAEVILSSQVHIDKSEEYRFFKPWLGDGLLISTGDKWRSHRKLIASAFHMNVLKTFVSVFYDNSMNLIMKLQREVGKEFDIHGYLSKTTVDILLETAMGSKISSENRGGHDYAVAVMKMCNIIHQRHYKFWYRFDMLFNLSSLQNIQKDLLNTIHSLTRSVIKTKKEVFDRDLREGNLPSPTLHEVIITDREVDKAIQKAKQIANNKISGLRDDLDEIDENDVGEKRRLAFLDLMIETAHFTKQLSDEEIKDQVDTIMFEGHNTTAAGVSFVLCMLGIHQDIQTKVYQEQRKIFGDSSRVITYNDTIEMKYLERVIMETLRLFPPVPVIARKINQDVQLVTQNCIIPAGATVVIGTIKIHRNPEIYPNPNKFDPDNFLPERTQNRHYYSFIPFSAGPRSCVGRKYAMLKLKVLLAMIIRNFQIKSNYQEKDFKLMGDIILKRADGFKIMIKSRKF